ncbi:hypothetical protein F5B19DRAFT_496458 [Rostrohypoxylon terebratum]|nr:hypothetical protein F5B19DRAFT_496458 [Rostrohypoxylon terebratum]
MYSSGDPSFPSADDITWHQPGEPLSRETVRRDEFAAGATANDALGLRVLQAENKPKPAALLTGVTGRREYVMAVNGGGTACHSMRDIWMSDLWLLWTEEASASRQKAEFFLRENLGGREISLPQGKSLGGSTALNGLLYTSSSKTNTEGPLKLAFAEDIRTASQKFGQTPSKSSGTRAPSVIPLTPRANPQATVYGVAEHADTIIKNGLYSGS